MSNEISENPGIAGAVSAEIYKIQTAEALEEAARRLRCSDISANRDYVRHLLRDVESRVNQLKTDAGAGYERIEADYHKKVEPVEQIIIEHPIPAVLIAAGIGVLIGMLLFKSRD